MKAILHKSNPILWILLFLLTSLTDAYADWNNFVIQYKKEAFGKGSHIWQIASYDKDWVYFANKKGMLQFDGGNWHLFPLNNGMDVRSVYPSRSQKRIYVAGINEFGYFSPNERGKLSYTCMSDSLEGNKRIVGNIWQIFENDNILYWQADNKVLKFLNGKYTIIECPVKIDCSSLINGTLYIGTPQGVMVLVGNTFFSLQGAEKLNNKRIRGFIPYEKGIIIATAYDGLYYWNGKELLPFVTGAEMFMSQHEVFSIATSESQIAVGTVRMGLLVIDKRTHSIKYFNENNGLQNNTVLSVGFDSRNNLWAGLDNGIDYICLNSSMSNLYSYPYSYGAGYAALLSGDKLYLGTNRGLFYMQYPVFFSDKQPEIRQIPSSNGQVWDLSRIGTELFCLHDRGLFLLNGDQMKRVGAISGVWNCKADIGHPSNLLIGLYDGICTMQKEKGEWRLYKRLQGMNESAENFEQESSNVIWLHNSDKGVIRLEIDTVNFRVLREKYYGKDKGFPSNKDIFVNKIAGKIYFSTPKGVYYYNRKRDVMEICTPMNSLLSIEKSCLKLYEFNNFVFSLNENEVTIANLTAKKKARSLYFVSKEYPSIELVKGFEKIYPLSDSMVIIPNDNGFALLKVPAGKASKEGHSMHINSVYLSYPSDTLIYSANFANEIYIPEIPYFRNAIRFEYDYFSFTHNEVVEFRYRLKEQEKWSDYSTSLVKEYSNLREGEYTFQVEARFSDGATSADSFTFIIRPPWYRTNFAYILYFLMLLFMLRYLYYWDDMRMKRKKLQAVHEKNKELILKEQAFEKENSKKEHLIMELEKEKLEYELQHKSQEMANLMINFVRKNEMLTEIKQELFKVMSTIKGEGATQIKQMLTLVNNKIDSNIQSDEVLKRIEEQFDLIHNNFMKHLSEKHPNLSAAERMMCAYLKMNLSSKEIAPLLNISLRGVETIRYRLRKKFNLGRDENLTDYLSNQI